MASDDLKYNTKLKGKYIENLYYPIKIDLKVFSYSSADHGFNLKKVILHL